MSYFKSLIDDLGARVVIDVSTNPNRAKAKQYINRAARWIYSSHHWDWRQKTGQITLLPNYTTGTCSVTGFDGTNSGAAMAVTFSGAVLSDNMKGRYISISGEDAYHRISYVDVPNNTVYLDSEVTRATGAGLNFKIWKRFYYLPGDVAQITEFGKWASNYGRMEYKSFSNLSDQNSDITVDGTPNDFTPFGIDNYEPSYSFGTISGSANSNLLTGGGAEQWLGNVMSGDLIVQGENTFTVKRVETNTRIILNNYLPDAIDTQAYEARRNLSIGFQFFPNNITGYASIPYYYFDRMFDMVNEDKDRPNLPDEFDDAILTRAEFKWKKDKGDSQWTSIAQLFSAELEGLKKDFRTVKTPYDIFAPEQRGYPGR